MKGKPKPVPTPPPASVVEAPYATSREEMPVIWRWIAVAPSTNLRICLSLLLSFGTGMRVIWTGWAPPGEWLMFLAGMAAIDVGQFAAKRITTSEYQSVKRGDGLPTAPVVPPEVGT